MARYVKVDDGVGLATRIFLALVALAVLERVTIVAGVALMVGFATWIIVGVVKQMRRGH